MCTSDSIKNWEHGPGAPVGYASSAFLETPTEFLIKVVRGRRKGKWKKNTQSIKSGSHNSTQSVKCGSHNSTQSVKCSSHNSNYSVHILKLHQCKMYLGSSLCKNNPNSTIYETPTTFKTFGFFHNIYKKGIKSKCRKFIA